MSVSAARKMARRFMVSVLTSARVLEHEKSASVSTPSCGVDRLPQPPHRHAEDAHRAPVRDGAVLTQRQELLHPREGDARDGVADAQAVASDPRADLARRGHRLVAGQRADVAVGAVGPDGPAAGGDLAVREP